ncbi:MAG: helix-turn-helix transcriptional regulator [Bermanella sp.]
MSQKLVLSSNETRLGCRSDLSPEHLSELIQALYGCSMNEKFLNGFLEKLCESCQLRSAVAIVIDASDMSFKGIWGWGNDQQEMDGVMNSELYIHDPMVQKVVQSEANQFYTSNLDIPNVRAAMEADMEQWSDETGITEAAGAMIMLQEPLSLMVFLQRGIKHPEFTPQEREFWSQLVPHFREALYIHQQLIKVKQAALETPAIMNSFPLPTFLINSAFDISMYNQKAKAWLKNSRSVALDNNQLRLLDRKKNNLLRLETSKLLNLESDESNDLTAHVLQWDTGAEKITFVLKSLNKTSDQGETHKSVLCFAHQAGNGFSPSIKSLQQIFGLSKREAEICHLLTSGLSVNDIAEDLCLSVHTVRDTLKKRIFIKCNCHSQNELITLLLTSPAIFMQEDALEIIN